MPNRQHNAVNRKLQPPQNVVTPTRYRHGAALSQRTRGVEKNEQFPYAPPEDWHEVDAWDGSSYKIVVQPPGPGYRHVVTPDEVRERLSQFPSAMLKPLAVVQLSRMTRKKRSLPCYGMQWGSALYLYPIEDSLIEYYSRPPKPAQRNEARMYGGRWIQAGRGEWQLVWTESAIKNFYLNNILIHEFGHLLDNRNRSYTDRERYAEWFAIEHGYRQSDRRKAVRSRKSRSKRVVRRHHAT